MKAIDILYRILMTRVKLIFTHVIFNAGLLSTYGHANSLGGRRILTKRAFTITLCRKWEV